MQRRFAERHVNTNVEWCLVIGWCHGNCASICALFLTLTLARHACQGRASSPYFVHVSPPLVSCVGGSGAIPRDQRDLSLTIKRLAAAHSQLINGPGARAPAAMKRPRRMKPDLRVQSAARCNGMARPPTWGGAGVWPFPFRRIYVVARYRYLAISVGRKVARL